MIAYIDGPLKEKDPTYVVVEANGVGYFIKISLTTYGALKELNKAVIYTHLHIKEDAHTLYGFFERSEKKLFLDLISISGVGPGTALMVLSSLSAIELQKAIVNEDLRTIQSIKGVGAKTAQRLILELKDKFKKDQLADSSPGIRSQSNKTRDEALQALLTLGIARSVAEKTLDTIVKRDGDQQTVEQLIKAALKSS